MWVPFASWRTSSDNCRASGKDTAMTPSSWQRDHQTSQWSKSPHEDNVSKFRAKVIGFRAMTRVIAGIYKETAESLVTGAVPLVKYLKEAEYFIKNLPGSKGSTAWLKPVYNVD